MKETKVFLISVLMIELLIIDCIICIACIPELID